MILRRLSKNNTDVQLCNYDILKLHNGILMIFFKYVTKLMNLK